MKLALYKKAAIAFAITLTILTVVGVVTVAGTHATRKAANARLETHQTLATIDTSLARLKDAESAERDYLLTGDDNYLPPFSEAKRELPKDLKKLDDLIDDTSVQQGKYNELIPLITTEMMDLESSINLKEEGQLTPTKLVESAKHERDSMEVIRRRFSDLRNDELELIRVNVENYEQLSELSDLIGIIGSILAFFTVAIAGSVTVSDIKRRLQLERELVYARDHAEQAALTKAAFLANMSHEIRTPMNGVIGMTNILLDSELSHEQQDVANTIRTSADSLLVILNDVLDFSKMEAGKLAIESSEFDLRVSLEGCVELLAHQAHAKGIELITLIDPKVPVNVMGDAGRLRQVLTNLIGNAIKFSPAGEVIIRVTPMSSSEDSCQLRFSVRDRGVGIGEDVQKKLFKPFTQADNTTMRKFGGTGLGLAISKQIVNLMGGDIGVISSPGEGSEFWFSTNFGNDLSLKPVIEPAENKLEGLRVLILDQSEASQENLHQQILSWGMKTSKARSHDEALDLLFEAKKAQQDFHLILCDMKLSQSHGMSISNAIEAVTGLLKKPKLIMMTSVLAIKRDEFKQLGIDATIAKPIKQSPLLNVILTTLQPDSVHEAKSIVVKTAPLSAKRILLAEDNPVNQRIALTQLAKLGYKADAVSTGLEALDALAQRTYDVVLMDCQMPGMDGYEATKRLRQLEGPGRRTPVIAMTAHALQGDREKCLEAGMDDYLSKPVKTEALSKMIAKLAA